MVSTTSDGYRQVRIKNRQSQSVKEGGIRVIDMDLHLSEHPTTSTKTTTGGNETSTKTTLDGNRTSTKRQNGTPKEQGVN